MPRLYGSPPFGRLAPPTLRMPFRSRLSLIACVLTLGLLPGCSLVPVYQRPTVPMPIAWSSAAQTPLTDTVAVKSGWWRVYQDPALDALVERSLHNNFSLASAVASVAEARANAEKAGAPLYPSLTLNGTFERSHHGGAGGSSSTTTHGQTLFAEAAYEVDFWGLNAANASSARMLARASNFDRDTVALTLTASVVDTWFQIHSLRQRVALAQTISDDAARILTLLQAQKAAGVVTELQVQQQRNALATFQAAIPTLQLQLDQNVHLLATLAGAAPEGFVVPEAKLAGIPVPQPRPNLPSSLLDTRPDIRSMEAQLQAANYNVGAARAAFFPSIVLTADGGLGSRSLAQFLSSPFSSLAASLAAPIFDGGALRGQLRVNKAAEDKSIAGYQQTVVTALQDVEDSLSAAAQQREVEVADQAAADAAGKAASLADAQYKLGTIDFLTVLDTQRALYQAEDTLVQTRLARLQASVSLFRAFGGGYGVIAQNDGGNASGEPVAMGSTSSLGPTRPVYHADAATAVAEDNSAQRPSSTHPLAP
ncbi:NodT family efflux transporter outer membrane factor (OMF) lipoprotein [Paraburkholderia sp. BL6669N2]|uniref:efflux transporter outer membrane subunit n=1 Tax=Paraburkholderia sp. BL6669N2 TaxID=1938807 RepID=UPI000E3786F6|nr:efflux transporter outer membrane subunit [Paraburkholderia sp. BL6669N2]REG52211.1 NodT family efflux transporter outer membrane factor (OMF) lipoprotein [Paraburkholderia sp. BL6669N2]